MKTGLINFILAICAVFFGIRAYNVWFDKGKSSTEIRVSRESESVPETKAVTRRIPSESEYELLVKKNLFSQDRAESLPKEPEPEPKVEELSIEAKKIKLYGVVMMGDYKSALITNSAGSPEDQKNKWIKIGDMIGEINVTDIRKDSVLVSEKEKIYEIRLYDKNKDKSGKIAEKPKESGKPTVVISESKAAPAQSKNPSAATEKPKSESEDQKEGEPKFEIINTPFGPMKRIIK